MAFTQLNPPIPVTAIDRGDGLAFAVIDYGPEHNLLWVTAMDMNGEIWCAPNPKVRMQKNWSMGRMASDVPSEPCGDDKKLKVVADPA